MERAELHHMNIVLTCHCITGTVARVVLHVVRSGETSSNQTKTTRNGLNMSSYEKPEHNHILAEAKFKLQKYIKEEML